MRKASLSPQPRRPGSGTYLRVLPRTTHISPICQAGGAEGGMNIHQYTLKTLNNYTFLSTQGSQRTGPRHCPRINATIDPSINIIHYRYDNILFDFCVLRGDSLNQPVRQIRPHPRADGRTPIGEHDAPSRTPHRRSNPDRPHRRRTGLVRASEGMVDCSPSRTSRRAPGRAQHPLGCHARSRHPPPGRRRPRHDRLNAGVRNRHRTLHPRLLGHR